MTAVAATAQKLKQFDPKTFLSVINGGRKLMDFAKKQMIFRQGDPSDAVFYLQKGNVQLTVVSKFGKEGVIGILKEGDFFGESCLTGEPLRLCSATALTDCSLMRIDKKHHDAGTARGTRVVRCLRGISAGTKYPIPGRSGGPSFQFQRKKTGPDFADAGPLWQGRHA